ncbi:MAG: hypothetical protein LBG08_00395 [Spirochaetaceae bacterium]|jgi:hypothetical protein|nr:hypothetical protein [Spirochaetaceae bacterium]
MKPRIPSVFFTILVFLVVLIPIAIVLINLQDIITWASRQSFLGKNALALVALIPLLSGGLLCLGVGIITKREEQQALAAHERMKKENPPGYSGKNELRDISALIDGINLSLNHIKSSSEEILSLSKTITRTCQSMGIKKTAPPPPVKALLCTDKFLEMPVSPEALTMAIEKINHTEERYTLQFNKDKFENPISEKEVLLMLLNRLKTEQNFHISR